MPGEKSIVARAQEALLRVMEDETAKHSDVVAAAKALLTTLASADSDPDEDLSPREIQALVRSSERRIDKARKTLARTELEYQQEFGSPPDPSPPLVPTDQDPKKDP